MGQVTALTIYQNYDSPNRYGDQQIQDLRIYKGTAKYTANFTPPGAILDDYTDKITLGIN